MIPEDQVILAIERTKLANERTFLAWVRTGLSCIGGGVAFVKLIDFHTDAHIITAKISGQLLIVIGMMFLLFSLVNYRNLDTQLLKVPGVKATPNYFMTVAVSVLIALSVVFLIII